MFNWRKILLYMHLSLLVTVVMPVCLWGQGIVAVEDVSHPADTTSMKLTGQRIMQTFDFEERGIHYLDLPMYWKKVGGVEGFPHYSLGKLDSEIRHGGKYSFKFIPDGGSVGFEYAHRRIKVKPGSDIQIGGYIHLQNARGCRAQLSCALTDRLGKVIEGSVHKSSLISQSDHEPEGWAWAEVYLPGNFPDAKYITVGVWFLQEEQWDPERLAESRIFQRNVNALVWFDDISIYQMPRVVLRSGEKSNVFEGNETARVEVEVEGVGTLDYQVHMTIHDAEGMEIRNESWVLTGVEGEVKINTFELADLQAGLYYVKLEIFSNEILAAIRKLTFAKLAPLSGSRAGSGRGFGVIVLDETSGDIDTAIDLSRMLNAKIIKLPVWRRRIDQGGAILSEKDFDRKLIKLQKNNMEVVATFDEVPDEMAAKLNVGSRTLLDVLSQSVESWRPQVAGVLAQYARQVPYWQIGADHEDQYWDPRIKPVVTIMQQEFDKLIRNTILTVPLSCIQEASREQVGTSYVSLEIPSAIIPEKIPSYLKDYPPSGIEHVWSIIRPLDMEVYGRENVLIDFAKRLAYAKKGLSEAIFIDHPWIQKQYNARLVIEPTELFLVFRTMADHLGSMNYVGQFNISPDVPALIFDRGGTGCLVTWNNNYDPGSGEIPDEVELYLSDNPEMVDIFGNKKTLITKNGVAKFRPTHWPILLSNIDTNIAVLRASLELSPGMIEADISRQHLNLKFVNPFKNSITGQLHFEIDRTKNKNWEVEPMATNFVLRAGQQYQQQIGLKFSTHELGGKKYLYANIHIDAERSYRINTMIPFEISLKGVDINHFTRRINQTDLLIQQVVTNNSNKQLSLTSFVDLPDLDHREKTIPRLQPGETVTKSFFIRNAVQWLGKYIRIGLYDPKGTKRINYRIEIN